MNRDILDFMEKLIMDINTMGIDTLELRVDHIAYSVSSSQEYDKLLPEFLKNGELVKEAIIAGRRVAVIRYKEPPVWKGQEISAVELIEPKVGETSFTGWEHAEFLVDDYDAMISKYPQLNWNTDAKKRESFSRIKLELENGTEVKFLKTPVLLDC